MPGTERMSDAPKARSTCGSPKQMRKSWTRNGVPRMKEI